MEFLVDFVLVNNILCYGIIEYFIFEYIVKVVNRSPKIKLLNEYDECK